LRIVAQLKEDGRSIKWEKINLPGRTVKSLQNMWTKINKQIADFEAQENNGEPTPVKTPRKRGPREWFYLFRDILRFRRLIFALNDG
jgi:hypothetical protein